MTQYSLDFSRKPKTIFEINGIDLTSKVGVDYFKNINEEIGFDRDLFKTSSETERQDFITRFITKSTIEEPVKEEQPTVEEEVKEEELPKKKKAAKEVVVEETEETSNETVDDVDLYEIMKDLEKKK